MSANAVERLVEAKIVTAIAAAVAPLQVFDFWTAAAAGTEKQRPLSYIDVCVMPRVGVAHNSDAVTLRSFVNIVCAVADDATGAKLPTAFEAVNGVIGAWDSDDDAAAASLDVDGAFRCDAVMFTDGGDCGFDSAAQVWFATIMLEVKGYVLRT